MVERFIARRPQGHEDFLKFDRSLREATDGRHIRTYLSRILEIVAEI